MIWKIGLLKLKAIKHNQNTETKTLTWYPFKVFFCPQIVQSYPTSMIKLVRIYPAVDIVLK